ncbi:uncharacterized protein K02A2.6-like [Anopheles funestus]|uniref:uncharacterized protein K02A2.6-like n=1 Tax=Anopheles funestus TaxID=62324 RepID=UPI0020C6306D|nr:uncharacterized protein K02A2.6-like [Anopheles funestus]
MYSPDENSGMDDPRRLSQNGANALNAAFTQRMHPPPQGAATQPQQPPSQHPGAASALAGPASQSPEFGMLYQMLQLMQQQMQQQQQQAAQQQQMMAQLMQQLPPTASQPPAHQPTPPTDPELVINALAASITEFRYDAEAGATFRAWYSRFEDLFVKDASRLDEPAKIRLLTRKLGTMEHERYANYVLPCHPRDFTFDETVSKLKVLFGNVESLSSRRYKCLQTIKEKNEDLLPFSCRLNRACNDFQFSSMTEDQFKCLMFVCALREEVHNDIRTRLLTRIEDRPDLTLEQLSAEGERLIGLKETTAMFASGREGKVHALHSTYKQRDAQKEKRDNNNNKQRRPERSGADSPASKPPRPCWLCGDSHWVRDCSYSSHKCQDCGRYGHREGHCSKSGRKRELTKYRKRTSVATRAVVVNVRSLQKRKYVSIRIGSKTAELQLDTGSDITIIGRKTWKQLGMPRLSPARVHAKTASGSRLQLDGEFDANVTVNGTTKSATILVVPIDLQLLGADFVEIFSLGTLPMDEYCNRIGCESTKWESKFPAIFNGTGLCTKASIKLHVKENVRPTFCPKRPVAYAMQATVEKELDRLEQLNVITPVDYSDWAAPIVVVRKSNGSIRICGDYSTGLNSALQSYEYPLPLPDDIFARLSRCRFFSKIDLSDAFLQVEIAAKYRPLLTINTHRGLYHYNRLPPGIKIAPAAFQQLIDTMLAGLKGTSGYMDDVIVGGTTEREHDENLLNLFRRIQQYGFTVRAEKCAFKMQQIEYLGFIIDRRGLKPNPAKIEAILKLPAPTNVSEVRSFLGAVNYYGRFVPKMRDLRYPLDVLLKNETTFVWTRECESAFKRFKEILASDLLLTHYDPNAEIVVSADASAVGLGATISHKLKLKVVQHASRALTTAENKYSQIDREGLAIIFAVKKKGIPVYTANRLQRFALSLQLYDFSIEYVPSTQFGNADLLSRLISEHAKPDPEYIIASTELEQDVSYVATQSIKVFPLNFRDVASATRADPILRQVLRYVLQGWPKNYAYGQELARFFNRSEALSTVRGCILFGERVVIPTKLRHRCIKQLHEGHPGMQRMKELARSYVYWPGMDEDIVECVRTCHACAVAAKTPPHAKPVPWPTTKHPWERIHVDYAGPIEGDYFLVAVDAYTKWPEVIKTSSTTTPATIAILRNLFARFGFPVTLVSDNGPQFTSATFDEFCAKSGIQHIKSPPFHPQSNGQAERFVDTFKRSIRKIEEGGASCGEALEIFLQTYRASPNPVLEQHRSPAEVMFGRKIRTALELLKPPPTPEVERERRDHRFQRNELVYAKWYTRNSWKWVPAKVNRPIGDVMYEIETNDHRTHRRHLNQLRKRTETKGPHRSNTLADSYQLPLDFLVETSHNDEQAVSAGGTVEPSVPSPHLPSPRPVPFVPRRHQQPVRSPRRSSRSRRLPRRLEGYQLQTKRGRCYGPTFPR